MKYIEGIEKIGRDEFEAFNKEHGNLLQSVEWADIKNNWDNKQAALYDENDQLAAIANILIKRLPMGYSMYYIPRGPVGKSLEDMTAILSKIKESSKKDRCVFIKFDPYILDNEFTLKEGRPEKHNDEAVDTLSRQLGAVHKGYTMTINETVQPRSTMGIYLDGDFRAGYARDAKRQLKKAAKSNLVFEVKTKEDLLNNREYMDEFVRLMKCTEQRQGISLRNSDYFWRMMTKCSEAVIGFAKTENGDYVCADLCVIYGNRMDMLYMGNDLEKSGKTGASRFVYDNMFQFAKDHGIDYADMGGVEGSLDDGLAIHKGSYGAVIREYIGEFDLPVMPLVYKMVLPIYEKKTRAS